MNDRETTGLPAIRRAFDGRSVVVCMGPGGVGKTSVTAAMALGAARAGRKTLAFTIDPARRLANAIGIPETGSGTVRIEENLDILMLDVRDAWERTVRRHSTSGEQYERIRANRFYSYLTDSFPGFNEYVAVEKLNELIEERAYDLIILDTPPTSYAMSFLEAPSRVLNVLDHNFIKIFLHPYLKLGRFTLRFAAQKEFMVLKNLAKFTGIDMLRELASFIFEFEGMFDGFAARAKNVKEMLQSPGTAFFIITSPDRRRLAESLETHKKLREAGYSFTGFVINRYCSGCFIEIGRCMLEGMKIPEKEFFAIASECGLDEGLSKKLYGNIKEHIAVQQGVRKTVARLIDDAGGETLNFITPAFPEDIHDMAGLEKLLGAFHPLR